MLEVIAKGMASGRVVSRQANDALEKMFESVRADIIAEHFTREHNAGALVAVAKELDDRAHSVESTKIQTMSIDAKSILGVFADFVQAKRAVLLNGGTPDAIAGSFAQAQCEKSVAEEAVKQGSDPSQGNPPEKAAWRRFRS